MSSDLSEAWVEEVPAPVPVPAPAPSEASSSVTTEEVVENVKEMLASDPPVKSTEERLNALIELLKGTYREYEHNEDEYRWTQDMLSIREKLNEL